MATIKQPYADPGLASFEVLDTYTQQFLLAGNHPELAPAVRFPLANSTAFAQFSVVGLDANGKVALATNGAAAAAATGTLTFSGTGTEDDTVTIGSIVYTLKDAPTAANEVAVGVDAAGTAANLVAAIMGTGTDDVEYGTGTGVHPSVTATAASAVVTVTAKVAGTASNAIATTEAGTGTSFGAATLTGGTDATGLKPIGVLAHSATLGASGTGNAQVWYSGCFNSEALVWDASFDTDAKKEAAFRGAPTPTNIIIAKRG